MPWRTQKLDGHTFHIMQRKGIASCGIACVAMVINRVRKSRPTERAIMQDSWALGEGGYHRARSDRKEMTTAPRLKGVARPVASHARSPRSAKSRPSPHGRVAHDWGATQAEDSA